MAKPRNRHGSPSPLVGEGRPSRRRGRGEGSSTSAEADPSPRLASLATPLPQGERGRQKVRVARIGAAHGVRGEVKLWSFTGDPLAVADYAPLETADGTRQFEIENLRPAKDHLVARFKDIADRNAAESLRNIDLYVPRDRLPAIDEDDTWYYADLVGLAAVSPDGEALGTVLAMHNFGAGDVIEIQPTESSKTLLLPFTEAVVPDVDIKGGRIVVVLPTEVEAGGDPDAAEH